MVLKSHQLHSEKAVFLRYAVEEVVKANPADALLLGGLDSGILAALDPSTPAITVALEGKAPDVHFSQYITEYFGVPWHLVSLSFDQAVADFKQIMLLTHSYDIGMKNNIPIYEGMRYAATLGYRHIRTGDGPDETMCGYSHFYTMPAKKIKETLRIAVPNMKLDSSLMAERMELHAQFPYLHPSIWQTALKWYTKRDLIEARKGNLVGDIHQAGMQSSSGSQLWGKVILRHAFEGFIPEELAWQQKRSLEYGSRTNELESLLEISCTKEDIEAMESSGKTFWNQAHGKLFLLFNFLELDVPAPKEGEYACTWCGAGIPNGKQHCFVCGAWPANVPLGRTFWNTSN